MAHAANYILYPDHIACIPTWPMLVILYNVEEGCSAALFPFECPFDKLLSVMTSKDHVAWLCAEQRTTHQFKSILPLAL